MSVDFHFISVLGRHQPTEEFVHVLPQVSLPPSSLLSAPTQVEREVESDLPLWLPRIRLLGLPGWEE